MFTVQPFSNMMTVKTMTGQQIYDLLEQQFTIPSAGAHPGAPGVERASRLQLATIRPRRPRAGAGTITPGSVKIGGVVVDPTGDLPRRDEQLPRVRRDGFTVFNQGTDQLGGEVDIDAFVAYFEQNSPVAPGPRDRITRLP